MRERIGQETPKMGYGGRVKQTLSMLVELQRLDDQLRDTRALESKIKALGVQNTESLEIFDKMLSEQLERITETRAFCAEKEEELKATEEDIKRSRTRLSSITSQRELNALNKELDSARRSNKQRTEELLKLMEQLETAQADFERKQAERDAIAAQMTALDAKLKADLEQRMIDASELNARREALRKEIGPRWISKYDRVTRGRGQGVADATGGRCGGCNMAIRPQLYQRFLKMEALEGCQYCQRLLIYFEGLEKG